MSTRLQGTSNLSEIDANNNLQVKSPGYKADGTSIGGGNANANAMFSEVDSGTATDSRLVASPEVDQDFRLRSASDFLLDDEVFNYTAQNTGKHQYQNTTMTLGWSASGLTTNNSNITTTTTGASLRSYATFSQGGAGELLYFQTSLAFSNQPTSNCTFDIGLFLQPTSNPFVPTDGFYLRVDSAGVKGVINNNGTETETLLPFTYTENRVYTVIIAASRTSVYFWIDDVLYANIPLPTGQAAAFLSVAVPFGLRQAHVGAAGAVFNALVKCYSIANSGIVFNESLGQRNNSVVGSYQGTSGGTMGSLTVYANSTNSTAAVPSNTALTANLPAGLGGHAWETFTLAVNTDAILMSYQIPAASVSTLGKRLKIVGVKLSSFVQTVLAGGPMARVFALAFGHTAVSMATAEAATTKARRIVLLPELTQVVTANQAVSTAISQPGGAVSLFPEPIYVNPGEFVALTVKHIGTVGTSGTIATAIQYIYSWE